MVGLPFRFDWYNKKCSYDSVAFNPFEYVRWTPRDMVKQSCGKPNSVALCDTHVILFNFIRLPYGCLNNRTSVARAFCGDRMKYHASHSAAERKAYVCLTSKIILISAFLWHRFLYKSFKQISCVWCDRGVRGSSCWV
jgi:hypothetical protein